MERKDSLLKRLLPLLLLAVLIPLGLWFAARGLGSRGDEESLNLLRQSIQRAAVQCYALEGFYPSDLEYLQEYYGVSVDQERYFVGYQYVASNLMPAVAVLPIP